MAWASEFIYEYNKLLHYYRVILNREIPLTESERKAIEMIAWTKHLNKSLSPEFDIYKLLKNSIDDEIGSAVTGFRYMNEKDYFRLA